jgi:2-(1,2-epoxy-1,2-dihydrophenyl)acetyl-CoA isomerase
VEFESLRYELDSNVLTITFNQPHVMNALTPEGFLELAHAMEKAGADQQVRAIILTGEGRGFCAGANLKNPNRDRERTSIKGRQERIASSDEHGLYMLRHVLKPTIAAVNGPAYGGGLSLALLCDIKIASSTATFGTAYLKIALMPGGGLGQLLMEHVGRLRATELLFSARDVTAEEALKIGMLNEVVAPNQLMPRARELAAELAKGPTKVLGMAKAQLLRAFTTDYLSETERESYEQAVCGTLEDNREGAASFVERRPPQFIGQ